MPSWNAPFRSRIISGHHHHHPVLPPRLRAHFAHVPRFCQFSRRARAAKSADRQEAECRGFRDDSRETKASEGRQPRRMPLLSQERALLRASSETSGLARSMIPPSFPLSRRNPRVTREAWEADAGWSARMPRQASRASATCRPSSSGRDLALTVTQTFDCLQRPAEHNITYSRACEDFVRAAILAYEVGLSHSILMEEMRKNDGDRSPQGREASDQDVGKVVEDFDGLTECGLVWLTLSRVPTKRWSTAEAVDKDFRKRWIGFVNLIVNAYFVKRMAWFPIDRLQLEQQVSCNEVDPPSIVAERARIVFTTLRFIAPQGY